MWTFSHPSVVFVLQTGSSSVSITFIAKNIVKEEGAAKLLSGMGSRVLWISIGGSIFLGVYEAAKGIVMG